ncbi:GDSL esterase/lipase [Trifolium repens]|nr:GDSL esterase/lipase [Trifolium repens]
MVVIASKTDNFDSRGPSHLTYVNWDDAYDRKSVASSLVQGVYVLEKNRQKERKGPDSLACHWWKFFHFQLLDTLIDDVDSSIFGAIYEFKPQPSMCNSTLHRSPRYVIAFRGTLFKLDSFIRDIELDLDILKHGLHETSRSKIATEVVRKMVASVGGNGSNIWLAGHSLGSSIALLAGKTMAKSGIFIESFLFNPPFPSAPLDQIIKSEKVNHGIRFFRSAIKTGLGIAMNLDKKISSYDSFDALSAWIPSLFVNPSDCICSEYVGDFEHRRKMEEIGLGSIVKIAAQISLGSKMMSACGKESEPLHLIPSAILTLNLMSPQQNCIEAHGIDQWWKPNLQLESKLYKY